MLGRSLCPFLSVGPPECDTTYADALGVKYDIAQVVYDIIVACILCFVVYRMTRVLRMKPFFPMDMQNRVLLFTSIGVCSLVIRAFDPFGWRKFVPFTIILACYDIGGACLLSIGFDLVFEWVRVLRIVHVGPDRERSQKKVTNALQRLSLSLQITLFVSNLTFSFLTSLEAAPLYKMHLCKIIVQLTLSYIVVFTLTYYGIQIYNLIMRHVNQRQQQQQQQQSNPQQQNLNGNLVPNSNHSGNLSRNSNVSSSSGFSASTSFGSIMRSTSYGVSNLKIPLIPKSANALTDSPGAISSAFNALSPAQNISTGTGSVFNLTSMDSIEVSRQRAQRILKIVVFCFVALSATTALWSWGLYQEHSHEYTLSSPNDPPQRLGDIFIAATFDIIQLIGFFATAAYFSTVKPSHESTMRSVEVDEDGRGNEYDFSARTSGKYGSRPDVTPPSPTYPFTGLRNSPHDAGNRFAYLSHTAAHAPQQKRPLLPPSHNNSIGALIGTIGTAIEEGSERSNYDSRPGSVAILSNTEFPDMPIAASALVHGHEDIHGGRFAHELGSYYSEMRDPRDEALFQFADVNSHAGFSVGRQSLFKEDIDIDVTAHAQMMLYQQQLQMQSQNNEMKGRGASNTLAGDATNNHSNIAAVIADAQLADKSFEDRGQDPAGLTRMLRQGINTPSPRVGEEHADIEPVYEGIILNEATRTEDDFADEVSSAAPESSIACALAVAGPVNTMNFGGDHATSNLPFFQTPANFSLASTSNEGLFSDYSMRPGRSQILRGPLGGAFDQKNARK